MASSDLKQFIPQCMFLHCPKLVFFFTCDLKKICTTYILHAYFRKHQSRPVKANKTIAFQYIFVYIWLVKCKIEKHIINKQRSVAWTHPERAPSMSQGQLITSLEYAVCYKWQAQTVNHLSAAWWVASSSWSTWARLNASKKMTAVRKEAKVHLPVWQGFGFKFG